MHLQQACTCVLLANSSLSNYAIHYGKNNNRMAPPKPALLLKLITLSLSVKFVIKNSIHIHIEE